MMAGMTVLPASATRVAPSGTCTSARSTYLRDPSIPDEEHAVVDRIAAVANDESRPFEGGDTCPCGRRLGVLGTGASRNDREAGQQQPGKDDAVT